MKIFRKTLSLALALCLSAGILPRTAMAAEAEKEERPASEYTWITDRETVDGGDYTQDPVLAQKLNDIFDGSAEIYYDSGFTKMVNTRLGSSSVPNNGVNKYVGNNLVETNVGTSCWIYANGVYFTLFGEATGCGTPGENSELLDLKVTANRNFSYENFRAWGIRPGVGTLIRTRCGHSVIVLHYDEERLTILDGNGNGKGLVAIRVITWDRMSFRARYAIQVKEEYFRQLYPLDTCTLETVTVMAEQETAMS